MPSAAPPYVRNRTVKCNLLPLPVGAREQAKEESNTAAARGPRYPFCAFRNILGDVGPLTTSRAQTLAWLLCILLTCLTLFSPHCDACDGPSLAPASTSSVQHSTPASPDTCNGICSCCVLQGLPSAAPALMTMELVAGERPPLSPEPAHSEHAAPFRPPRIPLS